MMIANQTTDPSQIQPESNLHDHSKMTISDQTMASPSQTVVKDISEDIDTVKESQNKEPNKLTPSVISSAESPADSPKLTALFTRILSSDLRILSSQKDAPDPSEECQMEELRRLYREKPSQFLYRFLSCVQPEDRELFSEHHSDPTVNFYLDKISQKTNDFKVIKNRRYARLQQLLADGSYFSDEEMKKRQPKLHYQMIGQFETEEEKSAKVREHLAGHGEGKFSEFLLHQSDRSDYLERNVEEEEEDEEEEEEVMSQQGSKEKLAAQFQAIMIEKFLAGSDSEHVCYQDIDSNERYDDLKMRSRDAEDSYFDAESDEEWHSPNEEDERPFNPPPLRAVATVMRETTS